ncbi:ZFYVE9 [Cordylochernes scorpioides]|uniref:ZFYVE9 n=1 Tax=Cordylochernes scorpioides TaxID=51811 RepID=A0ABY6KD09_9ARAC|nr:ZFYVE9 [Cordylochernes scorpioides]
MCVDGKSGPLLFALTKNLFAEVKLVTLSCCLGPRCWSVASQGLRAVGQDEVLLLLERESEERAIPRCAFRLLRRLWDDASRGQPASSDLGHVLFPEGLFGSRELSGFLLVRPTFQCLDRLSLPAPPFLLALLIQRWEVPWAKVFPLRLALRLGAEFRRYPCPAVSCRSRKPVYGEVGHTIMSVLADLRNFQFTVPVVPGVVIHMLEGGSTEVRLPRNRWEAVRRLLAANEHVVALGGNFSAAADSHLVCFQREDGSYHTQAINIQHTSRKGEYALP